MTTLELLRSAVRLADRRVAAVVSRHGLSHAEWRLLAVLQASGAVPPSLLAERLVLTRGGVTKLIDRLRARRLVVRAGAGGSDRRYQTIALTGAGAVLVRDLSDAVERAESLPIADRAAIAGALREDER